MKNEILTVTADGLPKGALDAWQNANALTIAQGPAPLCAQLLQRPDGKFAVLYTVPHTGETLEADLNDYEIRQYADHAEIYTLARQQKEAVNVFQRLCALDYAKGIGHLYADVEEALYPGVTKAKDTAPFCGSYEKLRKQSAALRVKCKPKKKKQTQP